VPAWRRSIAEDSEAGAPAKTAAAPKPQKGKERVPGQGELLLPIAGRKEQPKAAAATAHRRGDPRAGRGGNKACSAASATQIWIATILPRHDLLSSV
jgi:hypothetical protein